MRSIAYGSVVAKVSTILGLWAIVLATGAAAHDLRFTETLLVLKSDGTFQADVRLDLDALALGVPSQADDEVVLADRLKAFDEAERNVRGDRLATMLERRIRVRFDDQPVPFTVVFPERGLTPGPFRPDDVGVSYFGLVARLEGRIPDGAERVTFRASRAFPPVLLTVLDQQGLRGLRTPLELGAPSPAFALGVEGEGGTSGTTRAAIAWRYVMLGITHIVPHGLDHVLFVLGLFLLGSRVGPLLWQITAFTLAHTVTLALATFGVVHLPAAVVEPLIALSIAYVAIENLLTDRLRRGRLLLVIAFGLLHGLGFAGVLAELGLPPGERVLGLVSFNVGVELGQLAVVAAAFLLVGWWRGRPAYRRFVVVPASLAIAACGLYWAVTRAFF